MRWIAVTLFVLALLLPSRASWAAPPEVARAADLKAQADAAMDAHHYDEAVAAYTKAYELSPDPALLYNRGRAHEARSEYPEALDDIEKFSNEATPALRARVPKLAELLADLRARVATLQIACNVAGARVLVGGKDVGTTPLKAVRLNAGKTSVEVIAPDHAPYKKEVELTGGGTAALDVTLSPVATRGVLAVRTTPSGASIFVDDRPFGTAPAEGAVDAGRHSLVARAPGWHDALAQAVVEPGQRRQIDLSLTRASRSIFASPIFWTVVGVVVVGAAVTTLAIALTTERSADVGAGFGPPQLAGP